MTALRTLFGRQPRHGSVPRLTDRSQWQFSPADGLTEGSLATHLSRALPGSQTGDFSEPLAAACHGLQVLLNVPERSRTVGNYPQVDGLAEGLSAFGHGDAGRVRQITD